MKDGDFSEDDGFDYLAAMEPSKEDLGEEGEEPAEEEIGELFLDDGDDA